MNGHGLLKISDFGLAALNVGDSSEESASARVELLHTTCGTPNYIASEVIAKRGYDGKTADVWSMGVILYVMLAGFLPFNEKTVFALFAKINAGDFSYPPWFGDEAVSLMNTMLIITPSERLTTSGIKTHSWLANYPKINPFDALPVPPPPQNSSSNDVDGIAEKEANSNSSAGTAGIETAVEKLRVTTETEEAIAPSGIVPPASPAMKDVEL